MRPFLAKNYLTGKVEAITCEQDRLNYMFKNNLTPAPNLKDLEAEEERSIKRELRSKRYLIRELIGNVYDKNKWGAVKPPRIWKRKFENVLKRFINKDHEKKRVKSILNWYSY